MSEKIDNFCEELRTKLNGADKRLKDLKANAKAASEKTRSDAKAYIDSLEEKAQRQRASLQAAEARMKDWFAEKKTMTNEKIAEWKTERHLDKLTGRADRAEDYAVDAVLSASDALDQAEQAVAEAVIARIDADEARTVPPPKGARSDASAGATMR
jgi:hypothetical protein